MATLLDTGILTYLTPIFIVLLLFSFFYAILKKTKIFGENSENLSAVISIAISLLLVIMPSTRAIVSSFTPMFAILLLFVFLIFLFFLFLGVKGETMADFAKQSTFVTFAVITLLIVFLISLNNALGPIFLVTQEPGFWNATKRVIFSPQMLGALFLLMVAAYAVRFIGSTK